jgi:uncharacterized membrane protein
MERPLRARDIAPLRGPAWLGGGFRIFRRAPVTWIGLCAGWMAITLALVIIPLVGPILANLLQPVFFASFAIAAYRQLSGERIEMGDLFSGFRVRLKALLNVGAVLLIGELAVFYLMTFAGLPDVVSDKGEPLTLTEYVKALAGHEWILLMGLALTALVKGALWFAPALLAFHDLSATHAMRWSVYAALSNAGALAFYGITLLALFLAALLPWGLGLFVAVPMMAASTYLGYSDVFEEAPEPPPTITRA